MTNAHMMTACGRVLFHYASTSELSKYLSRHLTPDTSQITFLSPCVLYLLGFFNPRNFSNEDSSLNAILADDYLHEDYDTAKSLVQFHSIRPLVLNGQKKAARLEEPSTE